MWWPAFAVFVYTNCPLCMFTGLYGFQHIAYSWKKWQVHLLYMHSNVLPLQIASGYYVAVCPVRERMQQRSNFYNYHFYCVGLKHMHYWWALYYFCHSIYISTFVIKLGKFTFCQKHYLLTSLVISWGRKPLEFCNKSFVHYVYNRARPHWNHENKCIHVKTYITYRNVFILVLFYLYVLLLIWL